MNVIHLNKYTSFIDDDILSQAVGDNDISDEEHQQIKIRILHHLRQHVDEIIDTTANYTSPLSPIAITPCKNHPEDHPFVTDPP